MKSRFPLMAMAMAMAIALLLMGAPPPRAASSNAAQSPPPTGDLRLSYRFEQTGDTIPYHLYVPTSYRGEKEYPLVVVLHGGGSDQDRPFDHTGLAQIAEQRGYIVLAPLGYNRFGGFGNIYPVVVTPKTAAVSTDFAATARTEGPGKPTATPAPPRPRPPGPAPIPAAPDEYLEQAAGFLSDPHIGELSEAETLAAIAQVRSSYRIDRRRMYLMGNSAGGVATLYLAAKYPQMWAAIAPQGGVIAAWSYPYWRLRDAHIPALVVHGELDEHCNAKWSRLMVERARGDGADATFLLVPGGTHGEAWTRVLPQLFDFFDAHVGAAGAGAAGTADRGRPAGAVDRSA